MWSLLGLLGKSRHQKEWIELECMKRLETEQVNGPLLG